jgi:septum formation protein
MTFPRAVLNSVKNNSTPFVLASASPRRLALLKQIGVVPHDTAPSHINETPKRGELPYDYALRMAHEKAEAARVTHPQAVVLAADTVVAVGRRILPKTETAAEARACLTLLSGRRHRVFTAVSVWHPDKKIRSVCVETTVKFARLSDAALEEYIATGEWRGVAGGYAIQGCAAMFVAWLQGSYSAVVGLPLYETAKLLHHYS